MAHPAVRPTAEIRPAPMEVPASRLDSRTVCEQAANRIRLKSRTAPKRHTWAHVDKRSQGRTHRSQGTAAPEMQFRNAAN